ncbi:hypothetical protein [Devosia sp. XK-2]|uniref:hypothetical protein n=1 Tax=Devosia sp. XK-2 TaxID=3126689 RepID=UPI0030D5EAF0
MFLFEKEPHYDDAAAPKRSNMHAHPGYADFDQANVVHTVEVRVGERVRRACYYVEGGIVIASTGSKIYRCPIGTVPVSETVRAMLTEIAMADLD